MEPLIEDKTVDVVGDDPPTHAVTGLKNGDVASGVVQYLRRPQTGETGTNNQDVVGGRHEERLPATP